MGWDVILFDLDGTLTDSGPGITHAAQYALDAFGVHVEDARTLSFFVGPISRPRRSRLRSNSSGSITGRPAGWRTNRIPASANACRRLPRRAKRCSSPRPSLRRWRGAY